MNARISVLRAVIFIGVWMVVFGSLSGCVQPSPQPSLPPYVTAIVPGEKSGLFWWQACYRMPYDGLERPNWAIDAMLAHQVVRPVLEQAAGDIALWRFHRRAGVDKAGHQFTFLFYSSESAAERILGELEVSPVVLELQRAGHLKGVVRNCRGSEPKSSLDAHSDPVWHPYLQQAWPYYIMGVSASWLSLVSAIDDELGGSSPADLESKVAHYQEVHARITELWRGQGQHAYLHHLSAIFAYQPLLIQRYLQF